MSRRRQFLGFQLVSLDERHIQGEAEDPFGIPSFAILFPNVAASIMRQLGDRKLLLMPIYEGDIEKPTMITSTRELYWG